MIDWNKTTDEDQELIHACAVKAAGMYKEAGNPVDMMTIEMDITAAHIGCPLKLDDLLGADDFNFIHDVAGINRNINRETGEIENCFLPRFAA